METETDVNSEIKKPLSVGLNTMNNRLAELENMIKILASSQLNREKIDETFGEGILSKQKEKKDKKTKEELERIYSHFNKGLKKEIGERNFIHSIILIIHYTIVYVEQNIHKFSKAMRVDVSSSFKLDTCLELINKNTEILDVLPQEFYTTTIEHMCSLIYPKITPLDPSGHCAPSVLPIEIPEAPKTSDRNLKRRKSVISTNFLHKK